MLRRRIAGSSASASPSSSGVRWRVYSGSVKSARNPATRLDAWYAAPDAARRLRRLATAGGGIRRGGPLASARVARPLCVPLLPAPLERFILRDQAEDLLRAPGVVAVGPGRVPYGAYARLTRPPPDGRRAPGAPPLG